jgi:ribosomal-protein-alanine N-acetyltransferase
MAAFHAYPEYLVHTERLSLYPCDGVIASAVHLPRRQLETVLGARIAEDWLESDGRALLRHYAHWAQLDRSLLGWGLWLIEVRASSTVIGSVGFKGKPNTWGQVEIGYGISAAHRRQGYTTEAARALLAWAFSHPDVHSVTAECLKDNVASIGVLNRLGMTRTGSEGNYLHWRIDRK